MEKWSYLIFSENKMQLSLIYKYLNENGHECIGYLENPLYIITKIKNLKPDAILIEICGNFDKMRLIIEELEQKMLVTCFLVFESIEDEVAEYLTKLKFVTYFVKPLTKEAVIQVFNTFLLNNKKLIECEKKLVECEKEIKKFKSILSGIKQVEKAKWILAEQRGYSEPQAHEYIQKKSRKSRIPMKKIAEEIILQSTNDAEK